MRQKTWFQGRGRGQVMQRKCESGCLALGGAANGRRPEGFRPPSARASTGKGQQGASLDTQPGPTMSTGNFLLSARNNLYEKMTKR